MEITMDYGQVVYLIIPQVGNPQKTNSEEFEEIANR